MLTTALERIAVMGAGLMGTYLALDWARAGHSVTIFDVDYERARTAPERAARSAKNWCAADSPTKLPWTSQWRG